MIRRDSAVLVLYNAKGEILLQHRSKDAKRRPNYWGFFGGGVENGETHGEALAREIQEELEYTVTDPEILYTEDYTLEQTDGESIFGERTVFIEKYDETQELQLHEGQGMGWYKPSETSRLLMSDTVKNRLHRVEEYLRAL